MILPCLKCRRDVRALGAFTLNGWTTCDKCYFEILSIENKGRENKIYTNMVTKELFSVEVDLISVEVKPTKAGKEGYQLTLKLEDGRICQQWSRIAPSNYVGSCRVRVGFGIFVWNLRPNLEVTSLTVS